MKFKNIGLSIAFLGSLVGLASCGTSNNVKPDTDNGGTPDTSTGGNTDTSTGGNTDTSTGGNTDTSTGGNTDTSTGGNTDTSTGGNTDTSTGGNTDTSTGGNTDTSTGGNTDTSTGGNTDTSTGGNTDTSTGGNTDTSTGGNTDTSTGGNTDTSTGGNTDTSTGGNTDTSTGGNTDTSTGGNTDTSTGGDKITPTTPSIDKGSSTLEFTEVKGHLESLYAKFGYVDGATSYNVYIKEDSATTYTKVDKELLRKYSNYYRVDIVGLKSGYYTLKVCPIVNGVEQEGAVAKNITVQAHERSGFAFVNGTGKQTKVTTNTSSGAYNDNGVLKSNAVVVYVSNSNKDTVKAVINGGTYTGLQNIIAGAKKQTANSLCIRLMGNITDPAVMEKGDILIDAITCGLTIEGIGEDTTCNGFGIRVKNSSNVEIRNLGFMNCNSSEGDDLGLQQGNDHVWCHNNDFFYGDAGSDADQVKGDGALDTKTSSYITHSYNHFYDTGKSNLQGMKDEETTNYITYHHNWYDHSDSRHPRIRTCTVHIYNNYFDGNAKYGVGMTMGGSAFVENNYFRSTATMKPMLISGQGTDADGDGTFSGENGGIIKAYNNTFDGPTSFKSQNDSATSFDAYVVSSRNEQVPSSVTALKGGTTYNNFDTNSSLMYSYNVDSPEEAKTKVQTYAGRVGGGDFKWTFNNEEDDPSYAVNEALKAALVAYKDVIVGVYTDNNSSSGSTDTGNTDTTVTAKTADDVIVLIEALPESTAVTASNRSAIKAARAAYAELTSDEQLKVSNISKLIACEEALQALPQTSETLTFPTEAGDNSYFTVSGSLKSGIAAKTYDGVTYTTALKMESATSIKFTTTQATTLTIISDTASKTIKVNGTKYTSDSNGVFTIEISAGEITIIKGDAINVYAIIVG